MNYNANVAGRQPFGRKIKRVSDVNAMGYEPGASPQPNVYSEVVPEVSSANIYPNLDFNNQQYNNQNLSSDPTVTNNFAYNPASPFMNNPAASPYMNNPVPAPQLGVFSQPMVQDMAIQYGQQLASTGTTMLKKEVERYVPITKLKYYFAVDTKYVLTKVALLFFPFTHSDWSCKYSQEGPVPPRYEINAPDLYIPSMAYVSYVVIAGLVLGMQQRFSSEQLGILASSALAWCIVEVCVYSCTLYITNIQTSLRTLDLVAYSGYKYVCINLSVLVSIVFLKIGYYVCLAYTNLALAFFLIRTLKAQVLSEGSQVQSATYYGGDVVPTTGNKRRLYFLLFIAAVQPILSWWLSYSFIAGKAKVVSSSLGDI